MREGLRFSKYLEAALVVAIPKGKNKDLSIPKSYQPVSLLPTIPKLWRPL